MGLGVQGDGHVCVAKALADDFGRNSCGPGRRWYKSGGGRGVEYEVGKLPCLTFLLEPGGEAGGWPSRLPCRRPARGRTTDPRQPLAPFAVLHGELRVRPRDAERAAVRRYQGLDRTYALVSGVLRGEFPQGSLSDEDAHLVAEMVSTLDRLIGRWQLLEPTEVYRGVRDSTGVFGARLAGGKVAEGSTIESKGYLSTSIRREVALVSGVHCAAAAVG